MCRKTFRNQADDKTERRSRSRLLIYNTIRHMILRPRWWIGMGLILLPAAILRFTGFTFGLPYYDQMDEPWFFYEAAYQRGLLSYWLHPNPSPGLITLYKAAQVIAEALTHQTSLVHVTEIVIAMRFISIIVSLITLIFIGLTARELAGDKAGWLAAGTWAVIAYVVYHSFIALAGPLVLLFRALDLFPLVVPICRIGRKGALI